MNEEMEEYFTIMDNDEVSEGGPYLHECEFPADGMTQIDVHWAIQEEDACKKFYCVWVECKRNYVSKQKFKKYLINDRCFVNVEGGDK